MADVDRELARILKLTKQLQRALADGDRATAKRVLAQLRDAEHRRDQALSTPGAEASEVATSERAGGRARRRPQLAMGYTVAPRKASSPAPRARSRRSAPPTPPRTPTPSLEDAEGDEIGERPLREAVLDTLTLLGRPASIKLIVDVARARDGVHLPANRLTNLRRDDQRSFTSTSTRAAYVVPALTHDRFTPVRGTLASSAWPLAARINAPASGRVDFLHAVAALAADTTAREKARADTRTSRRLLWRLAHSIPDAVGPTGGAEIDPRRVRKAALAELAVHEDTDTAEREAAAERAQQQLNSVELLFGSRPGVIRTRQKEA